MGWLGKASLSGVSSMEQAAFSLENGEKEWNVQENFEEVGD